jgi:hypothetical protein
MMMMKTVTKTNQFFLMFNAILRELTPIMEHQTDFKQSAAIDPYTHQGRLSEYISHDKSQPQTGFVLVGTPQYSADEA